PASHSKSVPPHSHRPNGRSNSTSPPHARHRPRPAGSTISSTAPAAAVPSAHRSKQNRTASGKTPDSLPISRTTRVARRPPAPSSARATTSWVIPRSCTAQFREYLFHQPDGPVHRRRDRPAQAERPHVVRAQLG